jgi:hypothetical protein
MRLVWSAVALGFAALMVACPTPQSPKGPPPEYEEPAAPSWLDDGGTRASPDAGDAAAAYIAP